MDIKNEQAIKREQQAQEQRAREQDKLETAKAKSLRMAKKENKRAKVERMTKFMPSRSLNIPPQQEATLVPPATTEQEQLQVPLQRMSTPPRE